MNIYIFQTRECRLSLRASANISNSVASGGAGHFLKQENFVDFTKEVSDHEIW